MLHFVSLLDVLVLQCGLPKYTFQVVSFRLERTISLSRLAKVLKLISLCNLQPRTKELCWRLLDSRLLAKTAYCASSGGSIILQMVIRKLHNDSIDLPSSRNKTQASHLSALELPKIK